MDTTTAEATNADEVVYSKKDRQYAKASLTRAITKLKRVRLNDDMASFKLIYKDALHKLDFIKSVNQNLKQSDPDQSEANIDKYYEYEDKIDDEVIPALMEMKTWSEKHVMERPQVDPVSRLSELMSTMVTSMKLPKYELSKFIPNPKQPADYLVFRSNFSEIMKDTNLSSDQKLNRLYSLLGDLPREYIKSFMINKSEENLHKAIAVLDRTYGNSVIIAEKTVQNLLNGKPVKTADDMSKLSAELQSAMVVMDQLGRISELNGQGTLIKIVGRIQDTKISVLWSDHVRNKLTEENRYPTFEDLLNFISKQTVWVNDVHYGLGQSHSQRKTTLVTYTLKCLCCSQDHDLHKCDKFIGMTLDERCGFVYKHHLCINCLKPNHIQRLCRSKPFCSMCKRKHNTLLHDGSFKRVPQAGLTTIDLTGNVQSNSRMNSHVDAHPFVPDAVTHSVSSDGHVWFPVIKIFIKGQPAIALIDLCSTTNYINSSFAKRLGLASNPSPCDFQTLSGVSKCNNVYDVRFVSNNSLHDIRCYGVDHIPVPCPNINIHTYDHLKDLPLHSITKNYVDILLGCELGNALRPLEVRCGPRGNEPFAVRTTLGWYVSGGSSVRTINSHPVNVTHLTSPHEETPTQKDFKLLWDMDQSTGQDVYLSAEDKYVVSMWDNEVKIVENHIQLPIPIKEQVTLPKSRFMAERRLKSLVKRLAKEHLYNIYDIEMKRLVRNGYAEIVEEVPTPSPRLMWHIPHHHVPKKGNKIRIVNDCAAQIQGKSINTEVFQGPDLNNALLGVLLRFRLYQFAAVGDIEAMFMQVKVPEDQRDLLRFLWCDEDGTNIKTYRMTSHLFGGVWSPAACVYALQYCGSLSEDPSISNVIRKCFYVDDMLVSFDSQDQCNLTVEGVIKHLSNYGFTLKEIVMTNNNDVKECDLSTRGTLGLRWNPSSDLLSLNITKETQSVLTKRTILSTVAKIFDPLGLTSPVVLRGRQILQEVVRSGADWDDSLPPSVVQRFVSWLDDVNRLADMKIPRCVSYNSESALHVFVDASENGYGCCVYLVSETSSQLLFAKSRVAPSKGLTVPRLELSAAVLGAKIAQTIKKEIDHHGLEVYWTDSTIVLGYIKNMQRRFHLYVSNRVGYIHSVTDPSMWHHVPGNDNPADIASRGVSELTQHWFEGPSFLKCPDAWPVTLPAVDDPSDPEVKSSTLVTVSDSKTTISQLIARMPSYQKLRRVVGYALKFIGRCRKQMMYNMVEYLQHADHVILQYAQQDVSPSKHRKLNLTLEMGLFRVLGRIRNENLPSRQIFLPAGDTARLLVLQAHELVGHMGVNTTLAKVRENYWIARSVVKSVLHACSKCKLLRKAPATQKMSDIPEERLGYQKPAFYYTGLDCFGPIIAIRGRSRVKFWGLIFTCMTMRAIHLEKLDGLDTSTFLNGLERFFARRGIPKRITCDNATNFTRGAKELHSAIKGLDENHVIRRLADKSVDFSFIPPYSSHFGGIYERQIRTVRQVLQSMLFDHQYSVKEDQLTTFFCQVEAIVNSRPVSPLACSPNDELALRPVDLLIPGCNEISIPVDAATPSSYTRSWKRVHAMLDCFWRRWIRLYLPLLQQRSKWLKVKNNLKVGDIVLVVDPNAARADWKLGKIIKVKVSGDGLVRSAELLCRGKFITRSITKLVNLEII